MAWVCPECHLDYGTLHPPFAINTIKSFPRRFTEALASATPEEDNDAVIRTRPSPDVWSALEYTAHVTDILDTFAVIVQRMYDEDKPDLPFWDPDEKAKSDGYNQMARADVFTRLKAGADALVTEAERVDGDGWTRTATFPWGDRDLLTMLQNAAHEGVHHLKDAERVLQQVRTGA